jgi:site-specific recombinase XerD
MNDSLLTSWMRSLRLSTSAATRDAYLNDLTRCANWLQTNNVKLVSARRSDLEDFLGGGLDAGLSPATVARRYRSMLQFFKWADDEGELDGPNPMVKIKPPTVVVKPPPVISSDDITKLLAACNVPRGGPGRRAPEPTDRVNFENKRDRAMILTLARNGVRAGELMGMMTTAVDLDHGTITVVGKGNRERGVPLLPEVAEALDRYLRARRRHHAADLPWLWVGEKGKLTDSGLRQMLERRCADAGIDRINPHRFRHTFAHEGKVRGLSDENMMALAGWQSPQMLRRYGASATAERARAEYLDKFGSE